MGDSPDDRAPDQLGGRARNEERADHRRVAEVLRSDGRVDAGGCEAADDHHREEHLRLRVRGPGLDLGPGGCRQAQRALAEPSAELVDPPVVLVEAGGCGMGALQEGGQDQCGHAGEPGRDDAVVHEVRKVGRAGCRDK